MILPYFCLIPPPMLFYNSKNLCIKTHMRFCRINFLDQIFKLVHIKIGKRPYQREGPFSVIASCSTHFNIFVNDKHYLFLYNHFLHLHYIATYLREENTPT